MNKNVLIITHRAAQEVDGIIDLLRLANINVFRWNLCQFPEYEFVNYSNGIAQKLGKNILRGLNIDFGWIHSLSQFSFVDKIDGALREFAISDCNKFVEGVIRSMDCNWLNSFDDIFMASNKPFQLKVASSLGLNPPEYVITNDLDDVKRFRSGFEDVVIKNMGLGFLKYLDKSYKNYTKKISELSDNDLKQLLKYRPFIFQKYILKKKEIRVICIGNNAYSIEVDMIDMGEIIDSRHIDFLKQRANISRGTVYHKIESESLLFMKKFGLNYACFDWMVGEDNIEYFLECNPLGAFKRYEINSGVNLTTAIVNYIITNCAT